MKTKQLNLAAKKKKGKAIPVTGQGCKMSKFLHFLDDQLTDGGEIISLTR
jgi:hypothetical protein